MFCIYYLPISSLEFLTNDAISRLPSILICSKEAPSHNSHTLPIEGEIYLQISVCA